MSNAELEPLTQGEREDKKPRFKLVTEAVESGNVELATEIIVAATADDQRRIMSQLSLGVREQLCELLDPEDTAELFENLTEEQAAEILEEMPVAMAADVVEEMDVDDGGDLLREVDNEVAEAILAEIDDQQESTELRERASYASDSAGGLMSETVISFPTTYTVADVLSDLERNAEKHNDSDVQYLYAHDADQRLVGVLNLRSLVLARRSVMVETLMRPGPLSVVVTATLEELEDIFEHKAYLGLPVVREDGSLVGLVTRESVDEALSEARTGDYLKASGIVGGEELRSMPLRDRCLRRLSWLGPNILLNLAAASVIATNEATIAAATSLAIFLPMVSDMSGCSGNQAVAVSIRELTLGILQPRDFLRVMVKEGLLGLFNGVVLGFVLAGIVFLWKGSVFLAAVVGVALMLNTLLSVLLGGLIPLLLKRFKADPALASAPILTTCTDMCGFFLVLTLASQVLDRL